jgi:hypothetical protein
MANPYSTPSIMTLTAKPYELLAEVLQKKQASLDAADMDVNSAKPILVGQEGMLTPGLAKKVTDKYAQRLNQVSENLVNTKDYKGATRELAKIYQEYAADPEVQVGMEDAKMSPEAIEYEGKNQKAYVGWKDDQGNIKQFDPNQGIQELRKIYADRAASPDFKEETEMFEKQIKPKIEESVGGTFQQILNTPNGKVVIYKDKKGVTERKFLSDIINDPKLGFNDAIKNRFEHGQGSSPFYNAKYRNNPEEGLNRYYTDVIEAISPGQYEVSKTDERTIYTDDSDVQANLARKKAEAEAVQLKSGYTISESSNKVTPLTNYDPEDIQAAEEVYQDVVNKYNETLSTQGEEAAYAYTQTEEFKKAANTQYNLQVARNNYALTVGNEAWNKFKAQSKFANPDTYGFKTKVKPGEETKYWEVVQEIARQDQVWGSPWHPDEITTDIIKPSTNVGLGDSKALQEVKDLFKAKGIDFNEEDGKLFADDVHDFNKVAEEQETAFRATISDWQKPVTQYRINPEGTGPEVVKSIEAKLPSVLTRDGIIDINKSLVTKNGKSVEFDEDEYYKKIVPKMMEAIKEDGKGITDMWLNDNDQDLSFGISFNSIDPTNKENEAYTANITLTPQAARDMLNGKDTDTKFIFDKFNDYLKKDQNNTTTYSDYALRGQKIDENVSSDFVLGAFTAAPSGIEVNIANQMKGENGQVLLNHFSKLTNSQVRFKQEFESADKVSMEYFPYTSTEAIGYNTNKVPVTLNKGKDGQEGKVTVMDYYSELPKDGIIINKEAIKSGDPIAIKNEAAKVELFTDFLVNLLNSGTIDQNKFNELEAKVTRTDTGNVTWGELGLDKAVKDVSTLPFIFGDKNRAMLYTLDLGK